jgi:hypothetical protein
VESGVRVAGPRAPRPDHAYPPPPQQQAPPGETGAMAPEPRDEMRGWTGRGEIAPSYVFFASGRLSSYYAGEVLAPVGGETMPG